MGFYGNINNINRTQFQFDRIYSSRDAMETACRGDGVFVNRYVLISYEQGESYDSNNTIYCYETLDQGQPQKHFYTRLNSHTAENTGDIVAYIEPDSAYEITASVLQSQSNTNTIDKYFWVNAGCHIYDINPLPRYVRILKMDENNKILEVDETVTENDFIEYNGNNVSMEDRHIHQVNGSYVIANLSYTKEGSVLAIKPGYAYKTNQKIEKWHVRNNGTNPSTLIWEEIDAERTNFQTNFTRDKEKYNSNFPAYRGYDATVWQKVVQNGAETYIKIASLNTEVPTFDVVGDAPQVAPIQPYYDPSSTNMFYQLHIAPQWGFRPKFAANDLQVPQLDSRGRLRHLSDNNKAEKVNARQEASDQNFVYPSDTSIIVSSTFYDEEKPVGEKTQSVYYNPRTGTWDTSMPAAPNVDAAIYFNKSGFDSDEIAYSADLIDRGIPSRYNNKIASSNWKNSNYISVTPSGLSGRMYADNTRGTGLAAQVDTQELTIMLPALGDTIASIWDLIYGGRDTNSSINVTSKRNKEITWLNGGVYLPRGGLRLVSQRDKMGYTPLEVNTIAGCINSIHDILGMIITPSNADNLFNNPDNINEMDINRIFYNETNGAYYRKREKADNWLLPEDSIEGRINYQYNVVTGLNDNNFNPLLYYTKNNDDTYNTLNAATAFNPDLTYYEKTLTRKDMEYYLPVITGSQSYLNFGYDSKGNQVKYFYQDWDGTTSLKTDNTQYNYIYDPKYYSDKKYYRLDESQIKSVILSDTAYQKNTYFAGTGVDHNSLMFNTLTLDESENGTGAFYYTIKEKNSIDEQLVTCVLDIKPRVASDKNGNIVKDETTGAIQLEETLPQGEYYYDGIYVPNFYYIIVKRKGGDEDFILDDSEFGYTNESYQKSNNPQKKEGDRLIDLDENGLPRHYWIREPKREPIKVEKYYYTQINLDFATYIQNHYYVKKTGIDNSILDINLKDDHMTKDNDSFTPTKTYYERHVWYDEELETSAKIQYIKPNPVKLLSFKETGIFKANFPPKDVTRTIIVKNAEGKNEEKQETVSIIPSYTVITQQQLRKEILQKMDECEKIELQSNNNDSLSKEEKLEENNRRRIQEYNNIMSTLYTFGLQYNVGNNVNPVIRTFPSRAEIEAQNTIDERLKAAEKKLIEIEANKNSTSEEREKAHKDVTDIIDEMKGNNNTATKENFACWPAENFYSPNRYHFKIEDSYILDTSFYKIPDQTYYKIPLSAITEVKNVVFFEQDKHYLRTDKKDEDGNYIYELENNENGLSTQLNKPHYTQHHLYVKEDISGTFAVGMEWNPEINIIPASVTLSKKSQFTQYELVKIPEFARNLNTLHGLILKINAMLEMDNQVTRDQKTIQGTLNTLHDLLDHFDRVKPLTLTAINEYGQLASASIATDNWINASIKRTHKEPELYIAHEYHPIDNPNVSFNFNTELVNGHIINDLVINESIIDATGHQIGSTIKTYTLPYGYKTFIVNSGPVLKEDNTLDHFQKVTEFNAENTQDTLNFIEGNEWIKLITQTDIPLINGKVIYFAHKLSDLEGGEHFANQKSADKKMQLQFNSGFSLPVTTTDAAGHMIAFDTQTLLLPPLVLERTKQGGNIVNSLDLSEDEQKFIVSYNYLGNFTLGESIGSYTNQYADKMDTVDWNIDGETSLSNIITEFQSRIDRSDYQLSVFVENQKEYHQLQQDELDTAFKQFNLNDELLSNDINHLSSQFLKTTKVFEDWFNKINLDIKDITDNLEAVPELINTKLKKEEFYFAMSPIDQDEDIIEKDDSESDDDIESFDLDEEGELLPPNEILPAEEDDLDFDEEWKNFNTMTIPQLFQLVYGIKKDNERMRSKILWLQDKIKNGDTTVSDVEEDEINSDEGNNE